MGVDTTPSQLQVLLIIRIYDLATPNFIPHRRCVFAAREQLISRAHAGMTQRLPSGHPAAVYASIQEYCLVLREFCDRDNRTSRPLHRLVQQSVTQSSSRSHALAPDPDPGIVRPQRSPIGATLLVVSVCI